MLSFARQMSDNTVMSPLEKIQARTLSVGLAGLALALLLAGGRGGAVGAQPVAPRPQQVLHAQQADLVYDHRGQVEELALRLGVAPPGPGMAPDLGQLALRLDALLAEVSRTLNRRPARPVKLTIRLLPDGVAVQRHQDALKGLALHGAPASRRSLPSFYEPRSRTVFLSLADARLGVLAHEMTHFILCESSGTWPSEAFQESLARYLEERFNTGRSGF